MNLIPMDALQELIIDWAEKRNLIPGDSNKQFLKFYEEFGELNSAILRNDRTKIVDSIGDCLVVIIIYCKQKKYELNINDTQNNFNTNECASIYTAIKYINLSFLSHDPQECLNYLAYIADCFKLTIAYCLNYAWNEIKDRYGKTIDGTFIKEN